MTPCLLHTHFLYASSVFCAASTFVPCDNKTDRSRLPVLEKCLKITCITNKREIYANHSLITSLAAESSLLMLGHTEVWCEGKNQKEFWRGIPPMKRDQSMAMERQGTEEFTELEAMTVSLKLGVKSLQEIRGKEERKNLWFLPATLTLPTGPFFFLTLLFRK